MVGSASLARDRQGVVRELRDHEGGMSDPAQLRVALSSYERRGAWAVPTRIDARVTLGSIQLDLREAELGADTTIVVNLLLGSLEIVVPRDVVIEVAVDSLAASVDSPCTPEMSSSSPRRLRVIGKARFASCEIARAAP
jgi:hypothetical protein